MIDWIGHYSDWIGLPIRIFSDIKFFSLDWIAHPLEFLAILKRDITGGDLSVRKRNRVGSKTEGNL